MKDGMMHGGVHLRVGPLWPHVMATTTTPPQRHSVPAVKGTVWITNPIIAAFVNILFPTQIFYMLRNLSKGIVRTAQLSQQLHYRSATMATMRAVGMSSKLACHLIEAIGRTYIGDQSRLTNY